MKKIWLIGDTHFGHSRIIEYCGRPFSSAEQMDEILINNWNRCVRSDDDVFMLGDFALCGKARMIELGKTLKGRKTLILGNHDEASRNTYYEAGFEYISKYPILIREDVVLSHYPIQVDGQMLNLHGHTHKDMGKPRHICVSVECTNYAPIELKEACRLA